MSGSRFRLPSGSASRRSPELLPAFAAVLLLVTARPAPEPAEPAARNYAAVLARPIFAPDRAPVILQAPTAGSLNGYEVLGTAVAGKVAAALVRDATGRVIRVKPDAMLQGWRVVSIDRTQLTLDRDGENRVLAVTATPSRGMSPQLGAGTQSNANKSATDDDDDDDNSSNNKSDDDDDD
jgi:hypothetical protein